ncbi:hypothetical protein [Reichenbachiella versicolor]|uniref:hypothetical protein n=1 Tax=Reichenbachiella versicolor TaxID=1821036 RepID=UPI000D6E0718|nr:hypothetical protein [Reichenbachiella versicolor]
MSLDILYLVGYLLLLLIAWAFPIVRTILNPNKNQLITLSGAYLFLLADIKSDSTNKLLLGYTWKELNLALIILGVLLSIIGIISSSISNKKYLKLNELDTINNGLVDRIEILKEEYFKLCSNQIQEIFSEFFKTTEGNGRVSLYKHEGTHFRLLGRYANNPTYNKRGQEVYSDEEGFIAKGWHQDTFEIHDIPEWKKGGSSYKNYMKKNCTITDERLKKLTMRSCAFYIYRFNSIDADNPHGIIVFEKMKPSSINGNLISNIMTTHENQIKFLLKSMKSLF